MNEAGTLVWLTDQGGFERPDPVNDPYLDAFERVVSRFGIRRTTGADIANEAGVDRTTVFRNVGRLEDLQRMYAAREVHRFITKIAGSIPGELDGPATVVEVVATGIESAREHPVLAKILDDEPEVVGELIPRYLDEVIRQVVAALAPGLALAEAVGMIRPVDADALAEWIARLGLTLLVAPPAGPLRELLSAVLVPALMPDPVC